MERGMKGGTYRTRARVTRRFTFALLRPVIPFPCEARLLTCEPFSVTVPRSFARPPLLFGIHEGSERDTAIFRPGSQSHALAGLIGGEVETAASNITACLPAFLLPVCSFAPSPPLPLSLSAVAGSGTWNPGPC